MKAIHTAAVARSLATLREQQTHTLFAGYLYLQKLSAELGRLDNLEPDFLSFFKKFFLVANHPLGTPYIKLFTEQKPSDKNLWLNQNVAGSYAPSSLRAGQAFRKVVDIQGRKYSLPADHAERAFKHLLYSTPVRIVDLAIVLYRDFGVHDDSADTSDLLDIFAYEFGYSDEPNGKVNTDFQTLYTLESSATEMENLFEPTDATTPQRAN